MNSDRRKSKMERRPPANDAANDCSNLRQFFQAIAVIPGQASSSGSASRRNIPDPNECEQYKPPAEYSLEIRSGQEEIRFLKKKNFQSFHKQFRVPLETYYTNF